MRLYIDVDALCKCAHWDLLDYLPANMAFEWSESATLTSAKYRASKSCVTPDGKLFKTAEAAAKTLKTIQEMQAQLLPDVELIKILEGASGIDPGEATLFSSAAMSEDILVLTGDKRALRGLAKLTGHAACQKLNGKFICIEMLVLRLLDTYGLEWVREKICPQRNLDRAVLAILGSQCTATEDSVREALGSYIADLHKDCLQLLAPAYLNYKTKV